MGRGLEGLGEWGLAGSVGGLGRISGGWQDLWEGLEGLERGLAWSMWGLGIGGWGNLEVSERISNATKPHGPPQPPTLILQTAPGASFTSRHWSQEPGESKLEWREEWVDQRRGGFVSLWR